MGMSTTKRLLTLAASLFVVACGHADPRIPAARSAPETMPIAASASPVVADRMRADLVWYDGALDRIVRLDDGVVSSVQDRAVARELGGAPSALRVFDDGSAVAVVGDTLSVLPVDGSAALAIEVPVHEVVDGSSARDFWVGGWALATGDLPGTGDDYGACHYVDHVLATCVTFPNVGGYDGLMAVAGDGSVYMTDRDRSLYRWDGTSVFEVTGLEHEITSFHRSGTSILATTYMGGIVAVEGDSVRALTNGSVYVNDLAGSADDFWFTTFDSYSENVDPSCRPGFFSSCEQRTVWSQAIVWHSVDGQVSEAGYEQCSDAHEAACDYDTLSFGVDGGHAVFLGHVLRETAR